MKFPALDTLRLTLILWASKHRRASKTLMMDHNQAKKPKQTNSLVVTGAFDLSASDPHPNNLGSLHLQQIK